MKPLFVICAALLALAACENSPSPTGDEQPSETQTEPETGSSPSNEVAGGEDDDCVEECVVANQMRAVPAEQIEQQCRDECAERSADE